MPSSSSYIEGSSDDDSPVKESVTKRPIFILGSDSPKPRFRQYITREEFWETSEHHVHYPVHEWKDSAMMDKYAATQKGKQLDILVYFGGRSMDAMDIKRSDFRSWEMFNMSNWTQTIDYHSVSSAGPVTFGGIKMNAPYYLTKGTESNMMWLSEFNPVTNMTFQSEHELPIFDNCGVLWDNDSKFYFIGGVESDGHPQWHHATDNGFYWDTDNCTKNDIAPMIQARRNPTVVMDANGNLIVIGGYEKIDADGEDVTLDTVEMLCHHTDYKWMRCSDTQFGKSNAAACCDENRIYLSGGRDYKKATRTCETRKSAHYNSRWDLMPSLKKARYGHSMAMWNGSLIVLGGKDDDGPVLEIEMYDFKAERWTIVGNLQQSRYKGVTGVIKVWVDPPESDTRFHAARKRALSKQEEQTSSRRKAM